MAPTPPPLARARSVSSKIRFFSSALKMRRCALAGTSTSAELAAKGTAILASLTMFLLAALLCNYGRGKCLIDIGTEGFRIYDLRSTYATRLSAGGVADEWVTQLLRQGDAKVFKKYSQMKLQMKREALQKLNRQANESGRSFDTERPN